MTLIMLTVNNDGKLTYDVAGESFGILKSRIESKGGIFFLIFY